MGRKNYPAHELTCDVKGCGNQVIYDEKCPPEGWCVLNVRNAPPSTQKSEHVLCPFHYEEICEILENGPGTASSAKDPDAWTKKCVMCWHVYAEDEKRYMQMGELCTFCETCNEADLRRMGKGLRVEDVQPVAQTSRLGFCDECGDPFRKRNSIKLVRVNGVKRLICGQCKSKRVDLLNKLTRLRKLIRARLFTLGVITNDGDHISVEKRKRAGTYCEHRLPLVSIAVKDPKHLSMRTDTNDWLIAVGLELKRIEESMTPTNIYYHNIRQLDLAITFDGYDARKEA